MSSVESGAPGHETARGFEAPSAILRAAFEWLPIGVLMASTDGAIVLANHEVQRIFGYTAAELLGQSVDVLVPDALRPAHGLLRESYHAHPHALPIGARREVVGRRKDGAEVTVEVGLSPATFANRSFVLASVIDNTYRRGLQNELQAERDSRLEFESLIGELGAELINLRPEDVDRTIVDALARIVRALDLDRSSLFQLNPDTGEMVNSHQWTRPGWASPPPRVSARDAFPWHEAQVRRGELIAFNTTEDVPDAIDRESLRRLGTKSLVTVPLLIGGRTWGAVSFSSLRHERHWTPDLINRLRVIAHMFSGVLARKQADEAFRQAADSVVTVRDRLRDENTYLRDELKSFTGGATAIVGHSPAIRRLLEQVRQVAPTDSTVLMVGETGTGKGLLAARIHETSPRSSHPMVRVDCASLSAASIEVELFGTRRARGTADGRQVGRLALANGSTVLLDEVADLPLDAQASLMRVLRDKQLHPVDGSAAFHVDVRVIASTRRDLTQAIAEGTFRDDLYYQLNVFPLFVPPLRDRPDDIPLLVWRFVDEFSAAYGKAVDTIDKESMLALQRYAWPGNARELRNVVERALIIADGRHLRIPPPEAARPRQK